MSSHPYPARRGREVVAVSGWEYRDRRPAKDGQPYPIQNEELKGGSRGKPDDWLGETSSGLRSRQSGIGYGLSGTGAGPEPEPVPGAELLNLGPDGRDLGPENESRQLGQNAVLPLPRYSGCDVIASLPCFAASSL